MFLRTGKNRHLVSAVLERHFGSGAARSLMTSSRTFPVTSRVDLQVALDRLFAERYQARLVGVHPQYSHETLTIAHLLAPGHYPVVVAPLQHDEIDVGETAPARCLRHGMWLSSWGGRAFAVLVTPAERFGHCDGVHVEIAVLPGEAGLELSREFLDRIEQLMHQTGSYRGKVISLEATPNFSGKAGFVRVHKRRAVTREEVILPGQTLELLERNIHEFMRQREQLQRLGLAVKKGILFYGPPGTGKTHTIHYLAGHLRDHTTLLITAEQVGLLDQYFQLARFLQPAMVILEDVDLIARERKQMRSACEESLLNKLLNEMDGLREDAMLLFILTTNRPDQIETALTARPGRIDQAIEFPLPDEAGRRKLARLYARAMPVPEAVVDTIVRKTKGASAAFIKELMRRSAQFLLQSGSTSDLQLEHVEAALDEMLFRGGSLNVKLLGGAMELCAA